MPLYVYRISDNQSCISFHAGRKMCHIESVFDYFKARGAQRHSQASCSRTLMRTVPLGLTKKSVSVSRFNCLDAWCSWLWRKARVLWPDLLERAYGYAKTLAGKTLGLSNSFFPPTWQVTRPSTFSFWMSTLQEEGPDRGTLQEEIDLPSTSHSCHGNVGGMFLFCGSLLGVPRPGPKSTSEAHAEPLGSMAWRLLGKYAAFIAMLGPPARCPFTNFSGGGSPTKIDYS